MSSTLVSRGLLSQTDYTIFHTFNASAIMLTAALGILTNTVNIKAFYAMSSPEDGVTVSFLSLSISDMMSSVVSLGASISLSLQVHEMWTGTIYYVDPGFFTILFINMSSSAYLVTVLTTVYIAVARCMCVTKPFQFKHWFTRRRSIMFLACFFVLIIGVYFPILANQGFEETEDPRTNRTYFKLSFTASREKIKDSVYLFTQTIIPLVSQVVVSLCVVSISWSLRKSSEFRQMASSMGKSFETSEKNGSQKSRNESKEQKTESGTNKACSGSVETLTTDDDNQTNSTNKQHLSRDATSQGVHDVSLEAISIIIDTVSTNQAPERNSERVKDHQTSQSKTQRETLDYTASERPNSTLYRGRIECDVNQNNKKSCEHKMESAGENSGPNKVSDLDQDCILTISQCESTAGSNQTNREKEQKSSRPKLNSGSTLTNEDSKRSNTSSVKPDGHNTASSQNTKKVRFSGNELKVIQQVVVICTIFIVFNTPMIAMGCAGIIEPGLDISWTEDRYVRLYLACHFFKRALEQVSSTINIFIYYQYNTKFRNHCQEMFKCCRR